MVAFPNLFLPLFTFLGDLTSEDVQNALVFPSEELFVADESDVIRFLRRYIDECDTKGIFIIL